MIERARAGITERVRGFADKYHLPLLHRHTRECSRITRDFLIGYSNRESEIQKLFAKFKDAPRMELDEVKGDIWDPENHLLNQAILIFPDIGFIPEGFEDEFAQTAPYASVFEADMLLSAEGANQVTPSVRRIRPWVHALERGRLDLTTNGNSETLVIPTIEALNGSVFFWKEKK